MDIHAEINSTLRLIRSHSLEIYAKILKLKIKKKKTMYILVGFFFFFFVTYNYRLGTHTEGKINYKKKKESLIKIGRGKKKFLTSFSMTLHSLTLQRLK